MPKLFLKFQQVTFSYDTAAGRLFQDVTVHVAAGWSGVVGANGTGKTTFLKLATGLLTPDAGEIDRPANALYCEQRTDAVPDKLAELLAAETNAAGMLKNQLGLGDDWLNRWETLSHGERKRAQIAVALWLAPDLLAIDEPTNHVDADARELILTALLAFPGVGLLVSHDRELLDALCQQCLFIEPPEIMVRPGGVTKGLQLANADQAARQKQYLLQKRVYKKLEREAVRRRELAQQYQKKRSKRGIAKHDHDAKAKIDAARMSGKDVVGGKLLRQLDGRLAQAQKSLAAITVKKDYALGIWLPGSFSKRDFLLKLPADTLMLGARKRLRYPDLVIAPTDRIALTGPNGAGKSTLIRKLFSAFNVPPAQITYVPQEIEAAQARAILAEVRALPHEQLGHLMTIVSRLGSRPHRLLESVEPSPGETRKLLLALGMTYAPQIIVLDEPTNHLDLPSIECLEQALADCPCGLVLVSHDRRFLNALTRQTWQITKAAAETFEMQVFP